MVTTQAHDEIEHGTRRGYAQHLAAGSEPCGTCLRANADYTAEYRRRTGSRADRRHRFAGDRTFRDMRRLYPVTYRRLYEQHAAAWERENGADDHDT